MMASITAHPCGPTTLASSRRGGRRPLRITSAAAAPTGFSSASAARLKSVVLQIAAATDRGQLGNPEVAAAYKPKKDLAREALDALIATQASTSFTDKDLDGEWEIVYTTAQLFRSSPFFMALLAAYTAAGTPEKAHLFFRLHELQTCSWGASTIGRVAQSIDTSTGTMVSEFDTILFGRTVIPIIGWFKLLPTFGGRIITVAKGVKLLPGTNTMRLEVETTKTIEAPGIAPMPLLGKPIMGIEFPTGATWKLLPWNKAPMEATLEVVYCDEELRVVEDVDGELFVYMRPLVALAAE
mmetsp:Transcript_39129/g.124548  ORF Transcript_39129/g.124548 Transcript_39129/m.124548 type:complete len:297 (-) Transcript_39129:472-1362(-)